MHNINYIKGDTVMFACTIIVDSQSPELLQFMLCKLKQSLKGIDYALNTTQLEQSILIEVKCASNAKSHTTAALKKTIAEIGVKFFKKQYITRRLGTLGQSDKKQNAFRKALCYFDDDSDIKNIYDKIEITPKICLQSFFEFSLKNQKLKWDRVCNLANENPVVCLNETSFISLLEFLVDNAPYATKIVKITPQGLTCKLLYENIEEEVKNEEVFERMIELSPQQIIFVGDLHGLMQSSKYTFHVFEKKISFLGNNHVSMPVYHGKQAF